MAKRKTTAAPDPEEGLGLDFTRHGGVRVYQGNEEVIYFGWAAPLAPLVAPECHRQIEMVQGHQILWEDIYKGDGTDPDDDVFFWDWEKTVRGQVLPSLDQGAIGSCVGNGWARGSNDLLLSMCARGEIEFVLEDVAVEPIYGGSRVEVGKGALGSGDGSLGSWAAKWMTSWGVLLRKVYGSHDLRKYSVSKCREYGLRGCPDDLEPEARLHPVQSVALITSGDQAWTALGIGKPIPICSNYGFDSPLQDGFCARRGSWAHCMTCRGRFTHAQKGRCVVIQNSWGDYLRSTDANATIACKNGKRVRLPEGCFATTLDVLDGILKQRDSYAISDSKGFPERNHFRW